MKNELVHSQRLPFSVLFPEVHQMVKYALVRHFHVLQLRCVKILLDVCAEKVTRYIIALPEHPLLLNSPFLNLEKLHGFKEERVDALVINWHDKVSMYDDPDIARIVLPKVFDFARNQVLLKEVTPPFPLCEGDLVALSMLLVKNTEVLYKGSNWWASSRQVNRNLGHWFIEA